MTNISQLLAQGDLVCTCGQHHHTDLRFYEQGAGALRRLPELLRRIQPAPYVYLCFDQNLHTLFHAQVEGVLREAGIPYAVGILPRQHPFPNEESLDSLRAQWQPGCSIVVGVGSGVVNDCCKTLAFERNLPQAIIATAPSMDGYASSSSSLLVKGIKTTVYQRCPLAIIADTDLLRTAPQRMIWAGFGDMIAKYIALAEWRISHLVTGEACCPWIAALMRNAVQQVAQHASGLNHLEPQALESIMNGLVLSGMAMSYAANSRPASGLEHYFSHVWDMKNLAEGKAEELHGIQVGVGSLITLRILNKLRHMPLDFAAAEGYAERFDQQRWEARLHREFPDTAESLLKSAAQDGRNDPKKHAARLHATAANWPEICRILDAELPAYDDLLNSMLSLGMPLDYEEIGQTAQSAHIALICSRDMRDKYLTSTLLWDLGLLYEDTLWADCLRPDRRN